MVSVSDGDFKINFVLRKLFRENLNEKILIAEINVTFKVKSIQPMQLLRLDFHGKLSLRGT